MEYNNKTFRSRAVRKVMNNLKAGLFLTPGYGKTGIILYAFKKLKEKGLVDKMVVVSKKKIINSVWQKENDKWNFGLKMVKATGTDRLDKLKEEADVYLMVFDSFVGSFSMRPDRKFNGKKARGNIKLINSEVMPTRDMVVIDESTMIKNNSERTKRIMKICKDFKRKYILTGSPSTKKYLDLYYQIKFLDDGEALGVYYQSFLNEYFIPFGYMGYGYKIENEQKEKQLTRKIKHLVLSMGDENLDLPDLIPSVRVVRLDQETYIDKYLPMEKDLLLEADNETVMAANSGVGTSKLRQLANGFVYNKKQGSKIRKAIFIHNEKLESVEELVESCQGSPVLIAYEFNEDKERLLSIFKKAKVMCSDTTDKQALKIEEDWNAGEINVLLGQYASIAHGLNFQDGGCKTIITYGLPYNFEYFEQLIRRIRRPTTEKNKVKVIFLIMLITAGTIDERMLKGLTEKDTDQTKLLNGLKNYVKLGAAMKDTTKEKTAVKFLNYMIDTERLSWVEYEITSKYKENNFAYKIVQILNTLSSSDLSSLSKILDLKKGGVKEIKKIVFQSLDIKENNSGTYTMKNDYLAIKHFTKINLGENNMIGSKTKKETKKETKKKTKKETKKKNYVKVETTKKKKNVGKRKTPTSAPNKKKVAKSKQNISSNKIGKNTKIKLIVSLDDVPGGVIKDILSKITSKVNTVDELVKVNKKIEKKLILKYVGRARRRGFIS